MTKEAIMSTASAIHDEVVSFRRHLHAHPELSFDEHKTSAFVRGQLDKMQIPWTSVAGTGVVAILDGGSPGPAIALRADMDALPIQELNQVPYASTNPGIMHACGHDFHTSSLLGTTMILNQLKGRFHGRVKLLFQPGEEVLPGGASIMIGEGVLQNPKPRAIIAQHAMPRIPVGKIGIRKGKHMASMDSLKIRVTGKGGHGAQPDQNVDPVVIASHIVIALQQVVSRMANPREPTVLSIGKVLAKGAINVIPDEVYMEGTFRTMNESWREEAHRRMIKMAERLAESMGATCEFNIVRGFPFLVNEERLTDRVRMFAGEYLGNKNVIEEDIWMASEDFSYYSQTADACFYLCGVGNPDKGITSSLHTPTFDIDEEALRTSTGLMAYIALRLLDDEGKVQ